MSEQVLLKEFGRGKRPPGKEKAMKTILGILMVLAFVMVFAVVPTRAAYEGNHFNCISAPGYTDYVGVHEVPCSVDPIVTPNPMGGW